MSFLCRVLSVHLWLVTLARRSSNCATALCSISVSASAMISGARVIFDNHDELLKRSKPVQRPFVRSRGNLHPFTDQVRHFPSLSPRFCFPRLASHSAAAPQLTVGSRKVRELSSALPALAEDWRCGAWLRTQLACERISRGVVHYSRGSLG